MSVFCNGRRQISTSENSFSLIATLLKLYPSYIKEQLYDRHADTGGRAHFDKLPGIQHSLYKIKKKEEIITDFSKEWKEIVSNFLIY